VETLKIAHFAWESLYSEKVGGLASAATCLAESLADRHEVHYFTRGNKPDEVINNVHYHYVHPYGDNIVEYCRRMSLKAEKIFREFDRPRFDILHFHDWHFVEALHLLKDRHTVLTFHSTEWGRNGNKHGDWWEFREISGKEWYGAYIAGRCTAVSDTLRREVIGLYNVPDWKITVVRNGVKPERFYAEVDAGDVKQGYGIHPLAPLVFFAGRLSVQKGPDLLLAAIPEILRHRWDARFIFAGGGDMYRSLQKKAKHLPVSLLGHVPDGEFVRLLNASDIVVIPSRNEPFGLILPEAWSASRCVVASDVGGLSENITHTVDGIKVPVHPRGIARGVTSIIDDASEVRALGQRGRQNVERHFRWEKIAGTIETVYADVLP